MTRMKQQLRSALGLWTAGNVRGALLPAASFLIHRRTLRNTCGFTSTVFSYGTLSLPRKSNLMLLGSRHSTFSTCGREPWYESCKGAFQGLQLPLY